MKPSALLRLVSLTCCCCFPHATSASPSPRPPPPFCSTPGKPAVMLGEPLRFCGTSGMSCCNTADDAALGALFQSINVPQQDAMAVKKSLCQRCRPQGWAEEQRQTTVVGFDSLLPQMAVQQLLAPQNTWLLFMGPFVLCGLYLSYKEFLASCLGHGQTEPSPPRNERPNSFCSSFLCICCSTMTYTPFNRYNRVLFGESNRRSGAWVDLSEV